MRQSNHSILPFVLIAGVMAFGGTYLKGWRIITLEEVPNSHRPSELFLTADYTMQHFTAPERESAEHKKQASIFDVLGDN